MSTFVALGPLSGFKIKSCVWLRCHSGTRLLRQVTSRLQDYVIVARKAQYTPPTPTRRVIAPSLVTNLNSSTEQEIVNWVTTDGCVHSADTTHRTQLDFAVGEFVQTRRDCRQLVTHCAHTADATHLNS